MDVRGLLLQGSPLTPGADPGPAVADDVISGVRFLGIDWIGINAANGQKLLVSVALIVLVLAVTWALHALIGRLFSAAATPKTKFWLHQAVVLLATFVLVLGLLSIWFDDPTRLATAFGLVAAGLAFALQKVVTSLAGYFVILRGAVFRVGDRIVMGGVRGDVMAVSLTQTTIMEMGQPPAVQAATPEIWVQSRQYTGRIVNVPNAKVFEEPIYNYSRELDFIWEELTIPVAYTADRARAEAILLDAVRTHAVEPGRIEQADLDELARRYPVEPASLDPSVYLRLTDNWVELTVRFLCDVHGVRRLKDRISRKVLADLEAAGIGIASATSEIVGLPPIRIEGLPAAATNGAPASGQTS